MLNLLKVAIHLFFITLKGKSVVSHGRTVGLLSAFAENDWVEAKGAIDVCFRMAVAKGHSF